MKGERATFCWFTAACVIAAVHVGAFEPLPRTAPEALGWGGQIVFCVPTLDLVVATKASWQLDGDTADAQERAILEVIVEDLLPIIPVRDHPPRRPGGRALPVTVSGAKMSAPASPDTGIRRSR